VRVYLKNLMNVARGVRILKESIRDMPASIRTHAYVTGVVAGRIALIRDFTGRKPFLYLGHRDKYACAQGGVAAVIASAYLVMFGRMLVEHGVHEECPVCREAVKRVKKYANKLIPVRKPRIHPFTRPRPGEVPFSILCIPCENFTAMLIMEWLRDFIGDGLFFRCDERGCMFSTKRRVGLGDICDDLMGIRRVSELSELLLGSCTNGDDPPEYIDMRGIVDEIMEGGFLCEKHLKILRGRIMEDARATGTG